MMLYGNRVQALQYAMGRIGYDIPEPTAVDSAEVARVALLFAAAG